MQQLSITSHSLLTLLGVAAGCAGLLALWLIVRARRPARPFVPLPGLSRGPGIRNRLGVLWGRTVETFRELGARREWRYQVPWILFCGEAGIGKTTLADSIRAGRNEQTGKREAKLQMAGTRWSFFDSGVVIDVNGDSLPDAASDDRRWNQVLGRLIDRRPERALDGVVLVISARTLLQGTRTDAQRLAEACYAQLVSLQQRCEFQLPVYVVVTHCDVIEGFAAFWRAQPEICRKEILGWSNPCGLDNSYVPQWMDDAFEYMGGVLKDLQLQAAAADRAIADADEFFLAPQRFQALRDGVSSVLAYVFRVSAYRAAPFFRGVYFVGAVEDPPADKLARRRDLAFVDQLFTDKIFAEQNLARPLRQAVWSRHVLTRRLQYAAVTLGVLLCLSLANASMQLRRQVEIGIASVDLIRHPQHAALGRDGCVAKETVYELLSNISLLDVEVTSVAIPASWIDRRIENGGLHLVANAAFEKLIFPAFACELEHQARLVVASDVLVHTAGDSLTGDRDRLRKYLDQVLAFERARKYFSRLVAYSTIQQADELVADMEALTPYLYGAPVPNNVRVSRGYHRNALAQSVYRNPLQLPASMHTQVEQLLSQWSRRARDEISVEIDAGAVLLDAISAEQPPLLENAQRFDLWLQRMRTEWTAASPDNNPCSVLADVLRPKLQELSTQYGYDKMLPGIADDFDAADCYQPAIRHLTELHLAPQGVLFRKQGEQWQLTPALATEADGLARIVNLDIMQLTPVQPFSCQQPVRGWRNESLLEAAGFAREYDAFATAQHLDDSQGASPLYARVLRRQLQSVLDDSMRNAQVTEVATGARNVDAVDSLAAAEQTLAQQSSDLMRIYPSLIWILGQYQQLRFDSAGRITQCIRRYAADALQRLSLLSQGSGLYEVAAAAGDDTAAGTLFSLGAAPQIKDYLQTQFQRAQVLASYAGPFVSLLQNTDGTGDPAMPPGTGPLYWDNTRQEVNRVIQFKDTSAQAALLGDFVVKQMAALTPDNCHDVLAAYVPAAYGNDLFSLRRQGLENAANWNCRDEDKAAAIAQYQVWARRFGTDLAGKFPFAALGASADASLLVTRSFFIDYSADRDSLRRKLGWLKGQGLGEVAQFLDRLDAAAKLFGGGASADVLAPLHIKVEFRALALQSSGAENIISWRLQTQETAATYPNGPPEIDWRYGQTISLVATWAALSPLVPQADPQQPDMRVDGNVVSFQADGAWSLLKLILRHPPVSGVSTATLGPGTALLQFQVPTQDKQPGRPISQSRFYVAVRLSAIDPKTQAAVAIPWPGAFAAYAPSVW